MGASRLHGGISIAKTLRMRFTSLGKFLSNHQDIAVSDSGTPQGALRSEVLYFSNDRDEELGVYEGEL